MTQRPADADQLFERYRDHGDTVALGQFFDAASPFLFRIALAVSRDSQEAEDVLQETFLATIEAAGRHDASRPVLPWMVGILRHKSADARRRSRLWTDHSEVPDGRGETPDLAAARTERSAHVDAALESLPEPLRTTALLRWRHGLEPTEIAALRRERPSTVRVRLHRVLVRLRRDLKALVGVLPFFGGDAPHGLQAVRARVVSHAGAAQGAAAAAAAAGGVIVMSKLWIGALVVAAATFVIWFAADAGVFAPRDPVGQAESGDVAAVGDGAAPGNRVVTVEEVTASGAATPGVAPEATGPAISGTVRSVGGDALAGVVVRALRSPTRGTAPSGDVAARPAGTTTDAAGSFRVALPMSRGSFTLLAVDDEHGADCAFEVRADDHRDLVLVGTTDVVGHVVDLDGRPVGGAVVTATVTAGTLSYTAGKAVERRATAGDDGSFHVSGLPVAGASPWVRQSVVVRAKADGHPASAATYVPLPRESGGTAVADVVLRSGARIVGAVRAANSDAPIEGALVACGAQKRGTWVPTKTTRTDARGEFELAGVGLRFGNVRAWTPGRAAASARIALREDGVTHQVDLALHPAGVVIGRLVDHEGRPVANGHAALRNDDAWFPGPLAGAPPGRVRTDGEGRFRIEGVPAGEDAPRTKVYGAPPAWRFSPGAIAFQRLQSSDQEVTVARTGETRVPDLVLPAPPAPTPVARVHVTDQAGAPIEAALVRAGSSNQAITAADGVAEVDVHRGAFAPRSQPAVTVTATGFAARTVPLAYGGDAVEDVRVVLARGHRLRGTLVDHTGLPVRWTEVYATTASGDARHGASAMSDRDGHFDLTDLPPGPYELVSYVSQGQELPNLVAKAEDVPNGAARVQLAFPAPAVTLGALWIAVRDARAGTAVTGAGARLRNADGHALESPGAPSPGRVSHDFVPAGVWNVRVSAPGYLSTAVPNVTIGAGTPTELHVELEKGAVLAGRVRVQGASLPANARLQLLAPHSRLGETLDNTARGYATTLASDGSFRISGVARDAYRIAIVPRPSGPGAPTGPVFSSNAFLVVAGDAEPVLEVVPGGLLSVKITDPALAFEGEDDAAMRAAIPQLERTSIEVLDARGVLMLAYAGAMTHWEGPASRSVLVEGRYTVRLTRADGTVDERSADVTTGSTTDVTFGPR